MSAELPTQGGISTISVVDGLNEGDFIVIGGHGIRYMVTGVSNRTITIAQLPFESILAKAAPIWSKSKPYLKKKKGRS